MPGPRLDDLRTIPLFRGFADEDLAGLAEQFERTTLGADGVLFEIGEPAAVFYVLGAGEVTLDVPGDDTFKLRPPALIGELGGLAGLPRNCRAVASADAEIWALAQNTMQRFFVDHQELGVRFLVNLLEMVADKVHRDQRRLADMRANLVRTQKSLKSLREVVLEAEDTPISAPIYNTLDTLIVHNRRVNYRVEPPPALASHLRVDVGRAPVVELSRTHVTATWPNGGATVPALGAWLSGVAELAGAEIPVSGKVIRSGDRVVTIELDLLIEDYVAVLEGYLTRVQLLDILGVITRSPDGSRMLNNGYDWIIIGSGFGGSVSALRLAEKGYRVLVVEKGRRWAPEDFPKTNWDVRNWMWMPQAGLRGIFQMSFFEHVTIMHGVGVGGGSLVYANTLPVPSQSFFRAPSWAHLADWDRELAPHYATAKRMLGAAPNPSWTRGNQVLAQVAADIGRADQHKPTDVAVFFGRSGERVPDPYFGGKGPDRVGCTFCGACMTGCRVGAKNTLDRNYLYLAEQLGVEVRAETEVTAVRPIPGGYAVETRGETFTADRVIFAGGVMGTIPLLLDMKADRAGLPKLSEKLGREVRTNNEALIGVIAPGEKDLSKGVAITSILHTDEHSHIEPVRYGSGSGFFRTMVLPHAPGPNAMARLFGAARGLARHPVRWARALTVGNFAEQSQILLYMRTLESTITLERGRNIWTAFRKGLVTRLPEGGVAPTAFMEEATDLAERFADKVGGVAMTLLTETLLGVPSTAHILGGAVMGRDPGEGVIDASHQVYGYPGLYVIDGAAVSANPGVNPSLTITAMAERAMTKIAAKQR